MHNLLIDEPPLVFQPTLARLIGLNEAIFLQQIQYWISVNRKARRNCVDGRYWTYNSLSDWQEQFPFWSLPTLRRIIKELKDRGILIVAYHNDDPRDRTTWYSINYDAIPNNPCDQSDPMVTDQEDQSQVIKLITSSIQETNYSETTTENSKKRASEIVKSGGDSQDFYERFRLTYNERKPTSFAEMQICNKARQKVIDAFVADCGGKENALVALSNALAFCQSDPWYQSKDLSFDNLATKGKLLSLHERQISKELSGIPPELNNEANRKKAMEYERLMKLLED